MGRMLKAVRVMSRVRVWQILRFVCAIAFLSSLINISNLPFSTLAVASPLKTSPLGSETTIPVASLPRLNGQAVVEMQVNGQAIQIQLDGQAAPITAGNFVDLVDRGVYDGTRFHRVVRQPDPFVVQGGDPQSKDPSVPARRLGTGGFIDPATQKPRTIPLEILPKGRQEPIYSQTLAAANITQPPQLQHVRGAVAMARSPLPDSASSQFYVALADLAFLDGSYAVFGYVTQGMDVIDQVQQGDVLTTASVIQGLDQLQR